MHRSYLYMLSVLCVMQAGVTCTNVSIISSLYISIHKSTLQVLAMVVYIEFIVEEISFCLYNKM